MKRLLIPALVGAGLLVAVAPMAQDMSAEEQRDWFVGFVEGQLSTPDRQIRISNIDGILSEQASIREITISDKEGVWLRVNNAAIDWDQGALFTGRLLVRSLTAESIEYTRNAIPSGDINLPPPEAQPLQVPEFPVAIQLDQLSVPSVTFGENVFGLGSEIAVDGSLRLEGGSLDAALDVTRLDGPGGSLDANLAFRNADQMVDIDVTLREPPNGILANLLNIEGRPEIALNVTGSGPINDLRTTLAFDADGRRILEGAATLAQAPDGLAIDADLGGPIAELVPAPYRSFFGERADLRASALLRSAGGMEISTFQLGGGQLTAQGSAATTADGFLSQLSLAAAIIDPAGGRVLLPVAGAATSIGGAKLSIDFGAAGDDEWSADLAVTSFDNGQLKAQDLTVAATGIAANIQNPATRRITFNADGMVNGIAATDADVQAALGESAGFGIAGLWNAGEPLQLAELRVVGNALTAALTGTVDDFVFNGNVALETSSIAPFSGVAGRQLRGAMALEATGTVSPLIGGFDLTLDGTAENLAVSEPALDGVLAGTVRLAGRVARTAEGIEAEGFRLGNDKVQIAADGTFATGAANFDFSADLSDLAMISDQASGPFRVTGRAAGEGTIALELAAQLPAGRLAGKRVANADFGFEGSLSEVGVLTGALDGIAALDGQRVALTGDVAIDGETRRLTGFNLEAGATRLSGDIAQDAEGLFSGRLQLASSDVSTAAALFLVEARGSANATIDLSAANGTQAAEVRGSISRLAAGDITVGSANVSASLADLLGSPRGTFNLSGSGIEAAAIRGFGMTPLEVTARGSLGDRAVVFDSLNASGGGGLRVAATGRVALSGSGMNLNIDGSAPLALANRFVADRGGQFSGTATLRASVTGSFAAPRLNGTVSTSGSGYIDPELNLRLVDITGSASLAGDRINIDGLSAALATGGTISAGGTVGLASGNPANIAVRLNSARYADGNMLVATVSGNLALTGSLQRDPTLAGNIAIERADIAVPESFGGNAALVAAQHRDAPLPVKETIRRAGIGDAGRAGAPARSSALRLNVSVSAPNQIFIRGRGLDAEAGGAVQLTGSINDIRPVGGFRLIRGRLSILGQRIVLERGTVTLVGDLDPYLDFVAETEGEGVTVFVNVNGRVSELDVSFTSSPSLPEDEVLSRLLFRRSMTELSPMQVARLAAAAAELAGSSNTSLVDSLRARAGLADLDIVTSEDGNLAVQAGSYIQDNVYLGVQAGADGNSRVTINLDITEDIKAKASAGTNGDSSVGIFYETDY